MDISSHDSFHIAVVALIIAAIAVIGGVCELLYGRRITVDKNTGEVIDIELPIFGKLKTNYPSVGAIFLGLCFGGFVLNWIQVKKEQIPFVATVTINSDDTRQKADVFLGMIPQQFRSQRSGVPVNEPVKLTLNVDKNQPYDVITFVPTAILSNGSTRRVTEFGPMTIENRGDSEVGTFSTKLKIE